MRIFNFARTDLELTIKSRVVKTDK